MCLSHNDSHLVGWSNQVALCTVYTRTVIEWMILSVCVKLQAVDAKCGFCIHIALSTWHYYCQRHKRSRANHTPVDLSQFTALHGRMQEGSSADLELKMPQWRWGAEPGGRSGNKIFQNLVILCKLYVLCYNDVLWKEAKRYFWQLEHYRWRFYTAIVSARSSAEQKNPLDPPLLSTRWSSSADG